MQTHLTTTLFSNFSFYLEGFMLFQFLRLKFARCLSGSIHLEAWRFVESSELSRYLHNHFARKSSAIFPKYQHEHRKYQVNQLYLEAQTHYIWNNCRTVLEITTYTLYWTVSDAISTEPPQTKYLIFFNVIVVGSIISTNNMVVWAYLPHGNISWTNNNGNRAEMHFFIFFLNSSLSLSFYGPCFSSIEIAALSKFIIFIIAWYHSLFRKDAQFNTNKLLNVCVCVKYDVPGWMSVPIQFGSSISESAMLNNHVSMTKQICRVDDSLISLSLRMLQLSRTMQYNFHQPIQHSRSDHTNVSPHPPPRPCTHTIYICMCVNSAYSNRLRITNGKWMIIAIEWKTSPKYFVYMYNIVCAKQLQWEHFPGIFIVHCFMAYTQPRSSFIERNVFSDCLFYLSQN